MQLLSPSEFYSRVTSLKLSGTHNPLPPTTSPAGRGGRPLSPMIIAARWPDILSSIVSTAYIDLTLHYPCFPHIPLIVGLQVGQNRTEAFYRKVTTRWTRSSPENCGHEGHGTLCWTATVPTQTKTDAQEHLELQSPVSAWFSNKVNVSFLSPVFLSGSSVVVYSWSILKKGIPNDFSETGISVSLINCLPIKS